MSRVAVIRNRICLRLTAGNSQLIMAGLFKVARVPAAREVSYGEL
jgi:hypothetical protein